MTRTLIIGGTGTISTNTVEALKQRGHEVAVFNRGNTNTICPPVREYTGDRNDVKTLTQAVKDFGPDVILDFVCFLPEQASDVIDIVKGQGSHYVFVSTVDVYGYPLKELPVREETPLEPPISVYAQKKVQCENLFMDAHGKKGFPVTIVRPLYSLGPRFLLSTFSRDGSRLVRRIRRGKPVIVLGDGTTTIQPSLASNTGYMIARLAGERVSYGEIYNVGDERVMSHHGYYQSIGEAIGVPPNIIHIPTELLLQSDYVQQSLVPELMRFNLQYSLQKFKTHFPDFTPNAKFIEGIQSFVTRVETENSLAELEEDEIEDRIIAEWVRVRNAFTP